VVGAAASLRGVVIAMTVAAATMLACSGAIDPGGSDDSGGDGGGGSGGKAGRGGSSGGGAPGTTMPSNHSLNRNLDNPLVCADPKRLNVDVTAFSRLTNSQFVRSLRDLAAPIKLDDNLGANLPAEASDKEGYLNNWESQSLEAKVIEQVEATSRAAAKKIVASLGMLGIGACGAPKDAAGESACAAAFIDSFGGRAWRHPLSSEEKQRLQGLFDASTKSWGFGDAMTVVASAILSSPQFLYQVQAGAKDGDGNLKLTGYELATRLSYLVWGTTPDKALMDAAGKGDLDTMAGLEQQTARLLADPRSADGLAEFAAQWLRFAKLAQDLPASRKDKVRFPDYTDAMSTASFSGLQRFTQDALFGDGGGVQKLLTSNSAWVNGASASLYGVKASGDGLTSVSLDKAQRRGFLTQAAVMAGFAHETVQAPVQRGVFVLEHLLCSPPPPPPPNVPGAPPAAATDVETTRQKFARAHEGAGSTCKACHGRIDGVGFLFENYDGVGRWQTSEPSAKGPLMIDASGSISGTSDADGKYANAVEMIDKLAKSEQVAQCFVSNFYHYALSREAVDADGCAIAGTTDQVIADGGSFKSLLMAVVKSNQFRYRAPLQQ
jgi:hypothetical protein